VGQRRFFAPRSIALCARRVGPAQQRPRSTLSTPPSGSAWTTKRPRPSAPSVTPPCVSVCAWCAKAPPAILHRRQHRRAMATAKMVLGMLAGVDRPALATIVPTVTGSPSLLLDVAPTSTATQTTSSSSPSWPHVRPQRPAHRPSRVVCSPSARKTPRQCPDPRHPPHAARARRHPLYRQCRGPRPLQWQHDVAVCDGFVGNVAIKTCEAQRSWSAASPRGAQSTVTSQVGALLSAALQRLQEAPRLLRVRRRAHAWRPAASASSAMAHRMKKRHERHPRRCRIRSGEVNASIESALLNPDRPVRDVCGCHGNLSAPLGAHAKLTTRHEVTAARRGRPSGGQSLNRLFTAQAP